MEQIQVTLGDGRVVAVDAERYHQIINSIQRDGTLYGGMTSGSFAGRDSGEAIAFMVGQLTYTEATTFEKQYTPLQYEQFIPITSEAGEWADSIRFETYDYAGRGKRHSTKGRDIPLVDVAYGDQLFPVYNGAIGYDYTMEELRRTAYLRRAVTETKPVAALTGYRDHMNQVGLFGEDALTGLYNNAIIPQQNAPNGNWAAQIAAGTQAGLNNIIADVNAVIEAVRENTSFNDMPTDILMAPTAMSQLANNRASINGTDKTLLQWVQENNIAKLERGIDIKFTSAYGLDTAGNNGSRRMLAYVKRDDRLVMHIPMPLRFLAPQPEGLSVLVPGEYKYCGVQFRYPKSAVYEDNF
jgi:hypothetical protein